MTSSSKKRRKFSYPYIVYRKLRYVGYLRRLRRERTRALQEVQIRRSFDAVRIEMEIKQEHASKEREKRRIDKNRIRAERKRVREIQKEEYGKALEIRKKNAEELRKRKAVERAIEKQQKREKWKVYFAKLFRYWIDAVSTFSFNDIRQSLKRFRQYRERRYVFFVITVNSIALFLLSYLVIYLLSQLATMVAASVYHYPTKFYYWEVFFNISEEDWTPEAIKVVFASGPFVALVTGITSIFIYLGMREVTSVFKAFFLWAFIHGLTFFFGAIIVGTLFEVGIGYTIGWMYVMDTGRLVYSIVSLFAMVVSGMMITKQWMYSANSYFSYLGKDNRRLFMVSQLFFPYVAGIIILGLVRQPMFMFYESFMLLSSSLIVFPVLASYGSQDELFFELDEKRIRVRWLYLFTALMALAMYRTVGEIGLGF